MNFTQKISLFYTPVQKVEVILKDIIIYIVEKEYWVEQYPLVASVNTDQSINM